LIYEKIQKLCKERGVTIYKLEKELNFSESSICKWKSSNPSIDKVQAVADYFDVTVDFLIGRNYCNGSGNE